MPEISVIVPVYNTEKYLHRCIESILAQSFTDFELVLVDDGSPDNCGRICDDYAQKDKRIHVIHQKNGGLSAARNAGIDWAFANSESEWLSFIDSDDWVHPDFLSYLYQAVRQTGTRVSVCLFENTEGEVSSSEIEFQCNRKRWDLFYLEDAVVGAVAWNKLYAKELFRNNRYPVGRIYEDEFLTYKLLAQAGEIAVINARLYYYFQNPHGIMKSESSLRKLDSVYALKEQCRFAKNSGNMALFHNRTNARIGRLVGLIISCREASNLSRKEKKEALRFLRRELRKELIRNWNTVEPSEYKQWYFDHGFPILSWFYWKAVSVLGVSEKRKQR